MRIEGAVIPGNELGEGRGREDEAVWESAAAAGPAAATPRRRAPQLQPTSLNHPTNQPTSSTPSGPRAAGTHGASTEWQGGKRVQHAALAPNALLVVVDQHVVFLTDRVDELVLQSGRAGMGVVAAKEAKINAGAGSARHSLQHRCPNPTDYPDIWHNWDVQSPQTACPYTPNTPAGWLTTLPSYSGTTSRPLQVFSFSIWSNRLSTL